MARNKMSDLRNHLFETLEALKDEHQPMDLECAKTIALVAREINQSALTEVKLLTAMDNTVPPDTFFEIEGRAEPGEPRRLLR